MHVGDYTTGPQPFDNVISVTKLFQSQRVGLIPGVFRDISWKTDSLLCP